MGKHSLINSGYKKQRQLGQRKKLPVSQVLEHVNPPTVGTTTEQQLEGCIWEVGEVTKNGASAEQAALFPLQPLPNIQSHKAIKWVPLPW